MPCNTSSIPLASFLISSPYEVNKDNFFHAESDLRHCDMLIVSGNEIRRKFKKCRIVLIITRSCNSFDAKLKILCSFLLVVHLQVMNVPRLSPLKAWDWTDNFQHYRSFKRESSRGVLSVTRRSVQIANKVLTQKKDLVASTLVVSLLISPPFLKQLQKNKDSETKD